MFASLMPDLIGIDLGPAESLKLSARSGFVGLDLRVARHIEDLERMNAESFATAMEAAGVRPGYCSVTPMKMDLDEDTWRREMRIAPRAAAAAAEMGYRRATSVVVPGSDEFAFEENTRRHVDRVREIARVLSAHGIWFGLEYVSPATRRAPFRHDFVHSLEGMMDLIDRTGCERVGVMLDCFHWACAHESRDDLRSLRAEQIVAVHVNDLMPGVPIDEQVVGLRALPAEHGLVDIGDFIGGLADIGYDGPITAEPSNPKWRAVPAEESARATREAIDRCFEIAGVPSVRREANPTT